VIQPNVLVCLTQEAYNKFFAIIRPGGLLVTDSRYVNVYGKVDAVHRELPLYKSVMKSIGKPIVFNVCMLGAVVQLTGLVSPDSVMKVLETRIPPRFLAMNQEALQLGVDLAKALTG
jgi:2-oxoglutarate ferredoxin oxidoreductase subunit gamma